MAIRGTRHDDNLDGTSGNDVFIMTQGGNDTVSGGDGNDVFRFGKTLTAADHIDGGVGDDRVILNGDYSAGLTFAADTMTGVERLELFGNHDYALSMDDGNVAHGERLIVNASALGTGNHLDFDGSAETDGRFLVYGSAGDDTATGGAKADVFHLENGGSDTVHGGGGNDTFDFGAAFGASDAIDGGAGDDTVTLTGDPGALGFSTNDTGIETINLGGGAAYTTFSVNGDITDSGKTLAVDASGAASATMEFTNATSTHITVVGSAGDDTVHFGVFTIDAKIDGGTGGDDTLTITGDVGNDTLVLNPDSLTNIDHLIVSGDTRIEIVLDDANIAAGQIMTFDGSQVQTLRFSIDGEFETDGHLDITGGGAFGILAGGALSDTITTIAHSSWYEVAGMGGADTLNLSTGEDDLIYESASDSTSTAHDVVSGFDAGQDLFIFDGVTVGGFDGVLTGAVNTATLDADLQGITGGALVAGDAWEVDVTSGDLAGHQFLLVDANGNAQYDGGSDYLIDITGHAGTLSAANFIS